MKWWREEKIRRRLPIPEESIMLISALTKTSVLLLAEEVRLVEFVRKDFGSTWLVPRNYYRIANLAGEPPHG